MTNRQARAGGLQILAAEPSSSLDLQFGLDWRIGRGCVLNLNMAGVPLHVPNKNNNFTYNLITWYYIVTIKYNSGLVLFE